MAHWRTVGGGGLHAVHALLLSFPIALFAGGLASDIAYLRTTEIQWTNFSQWLITAALVFGGATLGWALLSLLFGLRGPGRGGRLLYVGLVAVAWALGLINAFKHSQDGWSSVGALGLALSLICTLLMLAAGFIFHSGVREGSR